MSAGVGFPVRALRAVLSALPADKGRDMRGAWVVDGAPEGSPCRLVMHATDGHWALRLVLNRAPELLGVPVDPSEEGWLRGDVIREVLAVARSRKVDAIDAALAPLADAPDLLSAIRAFYVDAREPEEPPWDDPEAREAWRKTDGTGGICHGIGLDVLRNVTEALAHFARGGDRRVNDHSLRWHTRSGLRPGWIGMADPVGVESAEAVVMPRLCEDVRP